MQPNHARHRRRRLCVGADVTMNAENPQPNHPALPESSCSGPTSEAPLAVTPGSAPRLWKVTVEKMVVVEAGTRHEAQMLGEIHVNDDDSEPTGLKVVEVKQPDDLPPEWRAAIPYGGDRKDYRECRERLAQKGQAQLRRQDQ